MDFDHARGEKVDIISKLRLHAAEKLAAEIAQGDLVCAACHRLRTAKRMEEAGKRVFWLSAVPLPPEALPLPPSEPDR
jgi:hypothetical protein